MSLNRENVTWPAPDGTWSIGFWAFEHTSEPDDPDFDHEWDVEYSDEEFWWYSTGHPTPDAAADAYLRTEANPGYFEVVSAGDPQAADRIAHYERAAAAYTAQRS